jgi:hypothetical protein
MEIPQFVQFALKVCEIFLEIKELVKGMKGGDDSFLVKISHYNSSVLFCLPDNVSSHH